MSELLIPGTGDVVVLSVALGGAWAMFATQRRHNHE